MSVFDCILALLFFFSIIPRATYIYIYCVKMKGGERKEGKGLLYWIVAAVCMERLFFYYLYFIVMIPGFCVFTGETF